MSQHFLSQLGLDRHADERAVKRAYAARLKSRRPDDDPALFQQLHEAYQGALEYVRRRAEAQPMLASVELAAAPLPVGAMPPDAAHGDLGRPGRPAPRPTPRQQVEKSAPPFNAGAFFDALLQQGLAPPGQLHAWLQTHPDLYSIQLRNALAPSLVIALEKAAKLPTPEGLRLLLAFFGLDRIERGNMHLQPRLEQLHDIAHRQHQVIVGPDMSFMYPQNGTPKPRPSAELKPGPIIPVILVLMLLANLARCVGNTDQRDFMVDPSVIPEQSPGAWPDSEPEPKPWQYVPPVPVPPPPAEPNPG